MVDRGGHILPTRMFVTDRIRGTSTEVRFTDLEVDPPIDETVFTLAALEQQRKLPGTAREPGR